MKLFGLKSLRKTLGSYTFQFAVGSVTILSVVVLFVMLIVYGFFSYSFFHNVHQSLSDELGDVEAVYHRDGIDGVEEYVQERREQYQVTRFAYILVDTRLNKIAGDLDTWPRFREYGEGWLSFELDYFQSDGRSSEQGFVARSAQLPGGYQLLVARNFAWFSRLF